MNFENLQKTDPTCYDFVMDEMERQETSLELIPSECIASLSTIEALGSPFTNKYSEGYANKRYYGGNEVVDKVELLAIERAKQAFPGVAHANVQAYSGSPANLAVYNAICDAGETIMGLSLSQGGHLTHGHPVSATSKFFNAVQYGLNKEGYIDLEEVESLALKHKPKVIVVGFTAYSREFPFKEFARIAEKVGAYLLADISHISGLVISGVHTSPSPYCDVIMTTTHKTLKGPRGAIIMTTEKGLQKDPDLAKKIDKSVFPGLQGGPHNHQTLAIAVALGEALQPEFKEMNQAIVQNSRCLANELINSGFEIATGGTDNHLILMSVGKGRGVFMQEALDTAGITLNKNTVPNDPCTPFNPSGIRMGTPIMTMRGMRETEMKKVASWMLRVAEIVKDFEYLEDKEMRKARLGEFYKFIESNNELHAIRAEVKELCLQFPIYK
ncbi:serine hydroxymethyltransferase [Candidatus Gracilibacteria bacterium 28_42_T64]|nr:serine hydroxymethyltransferase [Candidatus Gracilibacteria bacterium 28_42_T64]